MIKILLTDPEIFDLIEYEDRCGINSLLQELMCLQENNKQYDVYKILDDKGMMIDYQVKEI
jgi:hypothetical protein